MKEAKCARCGKEPGTVEARLYSRRKVSQLRGCACGNAVINRYAVRSVLICETCAAAMAKKTGRTRWAARGLSVLAGAAAGLVYYFAVEPVLYSTFIAAVIGAAVFVPFWEPNERRQSTSHLGWLEPVGTGADAGTYRARFRKAAH